MSKNNRERRKFKNNIKCQKAKKKAVSLQIKSVTEQPTYQLFLDVANGNKERAEYFKRMSRPVVLGNFNLSHFNFLEEERAEAWVFLEYILFLGFIFRRIYVEKRQFTTQPEDMEELALFIELFNEERLRMGLTPPAEYAEEILVNRTPIILSIL